MFTRQYFLGKTKLLSRKSTSTISQTGGSLPFVGHTARRPHAPFPLPPRKHHIHCAFSITMPSWWDYLHFNRQYQNKRNLEEGLFQIASQTCNILVKVNNTNNINLTRNNRSDEYGCAGPPKGKSSMQICIPKFRKESITSGCNPSGLSVSNNFYFL